ncbi:MAG TPA: hypothetical protein VKM93_07350 [Terriglobia bacterium]|nr:hypothetical protein [Terriglobia bacterium]
MWRSEATGDSADLIARVAGLCPAYEEDELDGVLGSSPQTFSTSENRYIFLEPVLETEKMLPVMAVKYDFGKRVPELRLRLTLFRIHNSQLHAFGLRFETPESNHDHKYYHAQLMPPLNGLTLPTGFQPWVPETQPCLVLYVEDEISLLACVLVSVYGLERAERFLVESQFGTLIRGHVKGMPWIDSDARAGSRYETDDAGRWRRKKP